MRLHHVALGARDVEAVAAFYRDLLGLPEAARHHEPDGGLRSIWLDLDGALLMIERTAEAARPVEVVGRGLFVVALEASPSRIPPLVRALAAAGTTLESSTPHTVYFRDPEGNRVALSAYPDTLDALPKWNI